MSVRPRVAWPIIDLREIRYETFVYPEIGAISLGDFRALNRTFVTRLGELRLPCVVLRRAFTTETATLVFQGLDIWTDRPAVSARELASWEW